ncbi:MAG TPA: alpha/beta fold hydrolase [Candidatus Eisenbacteria bacterium]
MTGRGGLAALLRAVVGVALAAILLGSVSPAPLAFRDMGVGDPPLVLIHAIGSDRSEWDAVAARLLSRHRIITVDLPGHGASRLGDGVRVATVAEALNRTLEALAVRPAVLVGHSYGGLVALAVAAEHPRRALGVAVVDIPAYNPADSARIRDLDRFLREHYPVFLQAVFERMSADSSGRERILAQAFAVPESVLTAYFQEAWRADLRPAVARLRAPLLVVATSALWPEGAPWDSVQAHLGYDEAPRAAGVRISGSGHFVPLDAPDSLAAALARFAGTLR